MATIEQRPEERAVAPYAPTPPSADSQALSWESVFSTYLPGDAAGARRRDGAARDSGARAFLRRRLRSRQLRRHRVPHRRRGWHDSHRLAHRPRRTSPDLDQRANDHRGGCPARGSIDDVSRVACLPLHRWLGRTDVAAGPPCEHLASRRRRSAGTPGELDVRDGQPRSAVRTAGRRLRGRRVRPA